MYNVSEALVRKWCELENVTGPTIKERSWLKTLSDKDKRILGEGRELAISTTPPGPMVQISQPGFMHVPQLTKSTKGINGPENGIAKIAGDRCGNDNHVK